jgi:hypothetical protein
MQRALAKVLGEMPDVKSVTASPSDSSMLGKLMMPRATEATTNPFTGNISYSPTGMQGMQSPEIEQTVAHELTHSHQAQNTPWYRTMLDAYKPDAKVPQGITPGSVLDNPYLWRPNEMEAFQAERNRAMRLGLNMPDPVTGARDIILPKDKKKGIDVGPSNMRK